MDMKQDLDRQLQQQPAGDHSSDHDFPLPPPQRRPRGFAASVTGVGGGSVIAKGRKEREKEKERTKLRERHRRAITSRMLAGLRQHGSFLLPARADMNDVLAALAREAGWIVEPDGTTYRTTPAPASSIPTEHQLPPPTQLAPFPIRSGESPLSATSLKNCSIKASLDSQAALLRIEETLSPTSFDSVVVAEKEVKNEKYANPINSPESVDPDQLMREPTHDKAEYAGTSYVPVYAVLSSGIMNSYCQLVNPEAVRQELRHLKSLSVDGVIVDCWWGIVEGWSPCKYNWSGYRGLFNIIQEFSMKLQVVMAFHESGGNDTCDMPISLPKWVLEIGKDNQDIFFTDREGRRNIECLSWGIDKERVLKGRTGVEVCYDFMRSFRTEFSDLFEGGLIAAVEVGLGVSGELKYPSFLERAGWRFPGIGEFQCYDKYMQKSLRLAAKSRGHLFWARGPDNAGHYNSRPEETGFFCDKGDYDSYYGRFFLHWYAQTLIDHADQILSLTNLAFEGTEIIVKIPAVYWWYRTASHAAELTAGFHNPTNQDGYASVFDMLKKHSVTMKFMCCGPQASVEENVEAFADADAEALSWQVLNAAWERGLKVAAQSTLPYPNRDAYMKILEIAKPRNDPDQHHLSFFVYEQQLSPIDMQSGMFFPDLDNFIRCMHGTLCKCTLDWEEMEMERIEKSRANSATNSAGSVSLSWWKRTGGRAECAVLSCGPYRWGYRVASAEVKQLMSGVSLVAKLCGKN